ncbi:polysaccharide biosynthesis tyrosine autokinase [Paraferrimonas sp. SM1919]|uniref:polysaccharide biosynthesis tyrosine autokinase n=1 Tax=Paraferrimonas sp. SM1919 TaxID=2662263 RepID=UPI0013D6143B|nr:polysaccharide biosynthesis tyrosine autokinase [Paraferrimonas sp. SM1919]
MTVVNKTVNNDQDVIDLGKLLGLLRDGRLLIGVTTALAFIIGVAIALLSTPVYKADALIQVESKAAGIPGLSEVTDMFAQESSEVTTELELIKSRMILGQVVADLNLDIVAQPRRLPIIGDFLARRHVGQPSQWQGYGLGGESISVSQLQLTDMASTGPLSLIAQANNQFMVVNDDGLTLFKGQVGQLLSSPFGSIKVGRLQAAEGTEFVLAKKSPRNAIADLLAGLSVSEKGKKSGILSLSYSGADPELIQAVLDKISQYYLLQNVQRTSAQAENSLLFLQDKLPAVKAELEKAEAALNRFQSQSQSVDMSLETEAILKQLVELEKRLNELSIKETEVQQLYTPSHPTYASLIQQRRRIDNQRAELTTRIENLPETQQQIFRLKRDVEVAQTIYLQLLNRSQELAIVKASTVGNVRIIDTASVMAKPVKPKKPLIVVLATLLGGMLGVATILVRAAFNKGIESSEVIESAGHSVYGSIPLDAGMQSLLSEQKKLPLEQRLDGAHTLLAVHNPASLAIESIRSLRTSLHFAAMNANNIIMISGPAPSIGKSFVSSNLAAVMAQGGNKVLLIDADMRKGYMQRVFGCKWDNGLSEILAAKLEIKDAIKTTVVDGLDFISRGQVPPNPSELLMQPNFEALLKWASANYDTVIVDTPPILAVTDAAIIGKYCGTSLLLVKHQETPLKELEYSIERFKVAGVNINGVVLNQMVQSAANKYGYYQYSYH